MGAVASAVIFVLVLSGCTRPVSNPTSGHGGHAGNSAVVAGARMIAVTARSFSFQPDPIVVNAGEDVTIALTATDALHDFTVEGVPVHVVAEAAETTRGGLRITRPGAYTAYCSVPGHRQAGMQARIVVKNA